MAYDFGDNRIPGEPEGSKPYWRDVGTIDSYFQSNMDLRSPLPTINLYNREWRIRTSQRHYPPSRFVRHGRSGSAADIVDSLVCEGSIISSALLHESLIGYDCFVHAGSVVDNSILLSGCDVGAGARLQGVLMDKNCSVEPGAIIGEDPEEDAARFPFLSDSGIVVVPKGTHVPRKGPIHLARDMDPILRNDPATRKTMEAFVGSYQVAKRDRRSHESAGPRYRRFGPGALSRVDELPL